MAFTIDDLKKKFNEIKNPAGAKNEEFLKQFLQLKTGTTIVRILPAIDDSKPFFAETKIHRIKQANGQFKNIHCRKTINESCPMCDLYYSLWKRHEGLGLTNKQPSKYVTMARMIKPTPRYYFNVYPREDNSENEVKILSMGGKLYDKIITRIIELSEEEIGDMLDVKSGFDYKIEKVMVEDYPNYDKSDYKPKSVPLAAHDLDIKDILSKRHDIHDLVKIEPYDVVKQYADTLESSLVATAPTKSVEATETKDPDYLSQMGDSDD